jgi:hypothetical protein
MRRHELDPISLVFGFAFAGLGLVFLIGEADQALRLRWVWPLLLLALGAGILFDLARTNRLPDPVEADRDPELDRAEPAGEPDATSTDATPTEEEASDLRSPPPSG